MFAEAIESILSEQCTPAHVRAIERGTTPQALATAIADAGFLELMAPEDAGGGGASWRGLFDVVVLCGAYAVPLPLAQTIAARTLVAQPDQLPPGFITFAPSLARSSNGSLYAAHVPFARVSSHVIADGGTHLLVFPTADAERVPSGIHGDPMESLRWRVGSGEQLASPVASQQFAALGALLHAALLAGAMKRAFDLTMRYANERVQFGKSIGKFQAIQHQMSVMAEHVAASRIAAEAAFASGSPMPNPVACAVAKARTSEAAQLVASIAHGVHGAIGVTEEYDLQLYTRRLHAWRIAHGSESYWNRQLGRMFVDSAEATTVDFVRSLLEAPTA